MYNYSNCLHKFKLLCVNSSLFILILFSVYLLSSCFFVLSLALYGVAGSFSSLLRIFLFSFRLRAELQAFFLLCSVFLSKYGKSAALLSLFPYLASFHCRFIAPSTENLPPCFYFFRTCLRFVASSTENLAPYFYFFRTHLRSFAPSTENLLPFSLFFRTHLRSLAPSTENPIPYFHFFRTLLRSFAPSTENLLPFSLFFRTCNIFKEFSCVQLNIILYRISHSA